ALASRVEAVRFARSFERTSSTYLSSAIAILQRVISCFCTATDLFERPQPLRASPSAGEIQPACLVVSTRPSRAARSIASLRLDTTSFRYTEIAWVLMVFR